MAGGSPPEIEVKAHRSSYSLFIGMMKWGTIAAAIVTALVILLIAA